MRGRRGKSSSSGEPVSRQQSRMALRKHIIKDISSESQRTDEDTQEDDAAAATDGDDKDELSLSLLSASTVRDKRRRERDNKTKPKEMTEEEMMALALRLSEQEASVTALRLQQEEEAVMKAIQESMVEQTEPSESEPLLGDTSTRLGTRRKLSFSNRRKLTVEGNCMPETTLNTNLNLNPNLNPEAKGSGDENNHRSKKRKRKTGSPLLEMPDLSQTQGSQTQGSPCSSNSPLSSDSTQIDDQLCKSPVFPLTGCRAKVHMDRLSQGLLDSYRTSGFVLCSQDGWTQKSQVFPDSNVTSCPKSPVFSGADRGHSGQTEPSPEDVKSPVFGRSTQHQVSSSNCGNSGFSSQESLTMSVRPSSPVFPRSPGSPSERFTLRGTEQSQDPRTSPVFGRTERPPRRKTEDPAEHRGPDRGTSPSNRTEDTNAVGCEVNRSNSVARSSPRSATEPTDNRSKDWNSETELTSDMTLIWSEEDDNDVTPVASPSPVFPEESAADRAETRSTSLNHDQDPAASLDTSCSLNPSSSSSAVTGRRQHLPTSEREPRPVDHQGTVGEASPRPGEAAGGKTVHYYWGVPFCPRGLDPDTYTQVIVAQMEVYEKSLKQAQRSLMMKAEWGEAVLPRAENSPSPESPSDSPQHQVPRRRGLKLKTKKTFESAEFPPAEEEEEEEEEGQGKENRKEEEQNEGDEEQMETDDCEICPETQLSDDDSTQDLTVVDDAAAAEISPSPKNSELPEIEMILRGDSPTTTKPPQEETMEVDDPVDENTTGNIPASSSGDARGQTVKGDEDPVLEEVKDRRLLRRSDSPELEPAVVPRSPRTAVNCPICQASFPASEIEMHAAYCDGEVAVVDERRPGGDCFQVSLRKRTRKAAEETNKPSNAKEKCFICQREVCLRDYGRHTELCIRRQRSKTAAKGNLLLALEKTDSRDSDAGPSGSKLQSTDVIDLRDDDDDDDTEVSGYRISNSPIRSFTPISEATDCLIDFRKQPRSKKPSQRRR